MVEVFAAFAMELITILNQCHRFRGFVYHHDRFSPDKKVIEIGVRPPARSAPLQPANRPRLSSQRRVPAVLGLRLAYLGRNVPGLLVLSDYALPDRAHEEDRSNATRPPATSPQRLQGQKADFQRPRRGPEQQSQTHHEKIVRLSHLPRS